MAGPGRLLPDGATGTRKLEELDVVLNYAITHTHRPIIRPKGLKVWARRGKWNGKDSTLDPSTISAAVLTGELLYSSNPNGIDAFDLWAPPRLRSTPDITGLPGHSQNWRHV